MDDCVPRLSSDTCYRLFWSCPLTCCLVFVVFTAFDQSLALQSVCGQGVCKCQENNDSFRHLYSFLGLQFTSVLAEIFCFSIINLFSHSCYISLKSGVNWVLFLNYGTCICCWNATLRFHRGSHNDCKCHWLWVTDVWTQRKSSLFLPYSFL